VKFANLDWYTSEDFKSYASIHDIIRMGLDKLQENSEATADL